MLKLQSQNATCLFFPLRRSQTNSHGNTWKFQNSIATETCRIPRKICRLLAGPKTDYIPVDIAAVLRSHIFVCSKTLSKMTTSNGSISKMIGITDPTPAGVGHVDPFEGATNCPDCSESTIQPCEMRAFRAVKRFSNMEFRNSSTNCNENDNLQT